MAQHGITILRISIGIIYIWFGVLKFFEDVSPAENFAIRTINELTFHLIGNNITIIGLAILETLIGVDLLFRLYLRATLLLLFFQMLGPISLVCNFFSIPCKRD